MSLVCENIGDDSQTFFLDPRYATELDPNHGLSILQERTLTLLPIQLHVQGLCGVFGRHVTKQRSDWPELFGTARTEESAQRYQTTFSVAILLVEVVGLERD